MQSAGHLRVRILVTPPVQQNVLPNTSPHEEQRVISGLQTQPLTVEREVAGRLDLGTYK